VSEAEIAKRLAALPAPVADASSRGYRKLFLENVTQADQGCDFGFLRAVQMRAQAPARPA
jgi:dihydroxy-acid dehydratase